MFVILSTYIIKGTFISLSSGQRRYEFGTKLSISGLTLSARQTKADTCVDLDTCANSVDLDTCANSVDLDTCANSVDLDTCANSVDLDTCANSVDLDTCANSVDLDKDDTK